MDNYYLKTVTVPVPTADRLVVIRRNPAEVIDGVVRGIEIMNSETRKREGGIGGDGTGYVMLRRVFDEIYYATEEMASRFPNEVMDPFKIERINEVLAGLRTYIKKETGSQDAAPANNEIEYPVRYFRLIEEGLTYSDVLLLMKWYKVLPR